MSHLPPASPSSEEPLSEQDLKALTRRHSRILKDFCQKRNLRAEQQNRQQLIYSLAQQMAGELAAQNKTRPATTAHGNAARAGTRAPTPFSTKPKTATVNDVPAEGESVPAETAENTPPPAPAKPATAGAVDASAGTPPQKPKESIEAKHFRRTPKPSYFAKFCKIVGIEGATVSLLFHILGLFFVLFYVVSTVVEGPKEEPASFVSGAGGGRDGERPSYSDIQKTRRNAIPTKQREHKILSKISDAKFTLPETPDAPMLSGAGTLAGMSSLRGLGDGATSSGTGGGLGGGIGRGMGTGIGDGRNFVGKFQTKKILGTNVTANRIAVYMDNSGSMTQVIPLVRTDILEKFPTSDVFEFWGCGMHGNPQMQPGAAAAQGSSNLDDQAWARKKKQLLSMFDREKNSSKARDAAKKAAKATAVATKKRAKNGGGNGLFETESSNWESSLSSYGKALLEKYSAGAARGGGTFFSVGMDLGQWINTVLTEGGYDTMIIFADFQDYMDGGVPNEKTLLENWARMAREKGIRVYLFTTEMMPQSIFLALTQLTQGAVAIPKEVAKQTAAAEATRKEIAAFNRKIGATGKTSAAGTKRTPTPATASAEPDEDDEDDDEEEEYFEF